MPEELEPGASYLPNIEGVLTEELEGKLLDLVEQTDSDFHDGILGYDNFQIIIDENDVPVLVVSFEDHSRVDDSGVVDPIIVAEGRWRLEFIDGSIGKKD